MDDKNYRTRKLTESELSRVRFDLAFRGVNSLASALMVVIFAAMLSIHGAPIFAGGGISGVCHGGIWLAVIAINFGLVRTGFQSLAWRNGRHLGVVSEGKSPSGALDFVFNLLFALIFVGLGIGIIVSGGAMADGLRTAVQIPLALLTITLGLGSAESCAMFLWRRRASLDDLIHEIPNKTNNATDNI